MLMHIFHNSSLTIPARKISFLFQITREDLSVRLEAKTSLEFLYSVVLPHISAVGLESDED